MHVEIKVAQNFVLDFLYNKLPRRRVNLFGEELESALRDKFADHWYPDKPFKGSAFRCLKITDPADPVLNRAARESGNPIPDITDNLPTDLAIWIDPGEVSYRIGEKGSVKILYSANDTINFPVGGAGNSSNNLVQEEHHNEPSLPTPVNNGFLPIENLNSAMSSLNVSSGGGPSNQIPRSLINPQQYHANDQGPLQNPTTPLMSNINLPLNPMMISPPSNHCGGPASTNGSSTGLANGFTPFPPRQHQPVTYTAGTFAQTKFGSTKLKSCGKKTNRMSPTEFSNYIKQRAMQKQGNNSMSTAGNINGGGVINPMNNMTNGSNMVGNGASQFRSISGNSSGSVNGMTGGGRPMTMNGFYGNLPTNQSFNAFNSGTEGGRMQPNMNQNPSHQQTSPDSFFYPLFPDRGGRQQPQQSKQNIGNQNSISSAMTNFSAPSMSQISSFQPSGNSGSLSSGGSSTGSSSASSTSSNNPWSYADADTETFLQDLLTMGLSSSKQGRNLYSDITNNVESGTFTSTSSGNPNSQNYGMNNAIGTHSTSGNASNSNSLGLSGNLSTLGNLNNGSSSHNVMNSGGLFGNSIDETMNGSSIKMMERMGSNSISSSQGNGSQSVGAGNNEKYQHRVLVAN